MENNTQTAESTAVKCTESMKETLSLYRQGLYDQAEQFAKLTYEEIEDSSSFEYSYSMYEILGELYKIYLNDETRVPHFRLLFQQLEVSKGYKPRDFANEMFKIGNCYRHNLDSADVFLQRALFYSEIAFGEIHKEVANVLNALSEFHRFKREYSLAVSYALRSLAINENIYEPNHYEVKLALVRISELYKAQGLIKLAEPYSMRAYEIWEQLKLSVSHNKSIKANIPAQDLYACDVLLDEFKGHTNFRIDLLHESHRKEQGEFMQYDKYICDYGSLDLFEKIFPEAAIDELFLWSEVQELETYFSTCSETRFSYEKVDLPMPNNYMPLSAIPTGGGPSRFELLGDNGNALFRFGVTCFYDTRHCTCPKCEELHVQTNEHM